MGVNFSRVSVMASPLPATAGRATSKDLIDLDAGHRVRIVGVVGSKEGTTVVLEMNGGVKITLSCPPEDVEEISKGDAIEAVITTGSDFGKAVAERVGFLAKGKDKIDLDFFDKAVESLRANKDRNVVSMILG